MTLSVVILAAGQGKRMKSDLPKVLQPLAGKPLLAHVLDTARGLEAAATYVVYGHGGDKVPATFPGVDVHWVLQAEQHGTGHAVAQAMPQVPDDHLVLVLYGDVPLVQMETLARLVAEAGEHSISVLSVMLPDPTGYGRIVRDGAGTVVRIVEHKDANAKERAIHECNTGLMCLPAGRLRRWLAALRNDNAQGEYYLTDVIVAAVKAGLKVRAVIAPTPTEVMGVNDKVQLAELEAAYRRQRATELMLAGATIVDPARFDARGPVTVGRDVFIDANVLLEGTVRLGDRVRLGPNVVVRDSEIGADTVIHPNCVIDRARIGAQCSIGPFARFRPSAELAAGVHIGNFVEVKNSVIGPGSKANHLSYLGDTTVGEKVNVGAGTITCNYDGANKWRTEIGDRVFIGSGTMLVAPVKVGAGATIGAGSTITRDVPEDMLTLERSKQVTVPGWQRPVKKT
ncbi:MAG TPA: bifunctional UDP-N-acetylglucosamine diphosphorylase/glucosamine-1-phosphate N-acetyltransferase GlmU [Steroidobacteraceae bacterium]|nr:bifunctional UDP-N-acetylglucosamine diphosphorylase/glucosamine-1-phosphate N-acetyltransferase GlmU [Steroidobacteraceae bacterium]